jgi:zinc protease
MHTQRGESASSNRPQPGTPRPYQFPPFERRTLRNGVEVIVAPLPRYPLVSVRVLLDAGASTEERRLAGVASLTTQSLAEGTERLDGAALAESFERLGGSLSVGASWDGLHVATTVMRDRFTAVLQLLGEVVLKPAFPEREVARLREERLAELMEIRAEPRALADEMFEAFVYPPASRFTLPEAGSPDTVRALARADVLAFHGERFRPAATTVIVVGDVEVDRAVKSVEEIVDEWPAADDILRSSAPVTAAPPSGVHVIHREDAPQTELRVGHVGLPRLHPDYFAVVIMNAILGGLFNSRINLNLREQHAFTYGASSAFEWRRSAGPFVISTAVATEVTVPAIREIISEVNRMRNGMPSADELSLAVSYLEGVFPIRFETTEAIAAALAALKTFGLPDHYYDTYRARIRAVTAEEVEHAAQEHLHPLKSQVVAVGDATRIGPELEALGLGRVEYHDAEGAVVASAR